MSFLQYCILRAFSGTYDILRLGHMCPLRSVAAKKPGGLHGFTRWKARFRQLIPVRARLAAVDHCNGLVMEASSVARGDMKLGGNIHKAISLSVKADQRHNVVYRTGNAHQ